MVAAIHSLGLRRSVDVHEFAKYPMLYNPDLPDDVHAAVRARGRATDGAGDAGPHRRVQHRARGPAHPREAER